MNRPVDRLAYSMTEAAKAIGISRAYLYELVKRGELRTFHLGRRQLVSVDALREFIKKLEQGGDSQ